MSEKVIEIKVLLLSFATLLVTEVAFHIFLENTTHFPMGVLGITRLLEISFVFLIVSIWGQGMATVGLARNQILHGFKKGLIWSAIFATCSLLLFAVFYAAHIAPLRLLRTHLPASPQGLVLFFIVGGLVAPFAEEVFFRGIIYSFLRRWGALVAILGSTVVFVMAHSIDSAVPMTQIVGGIVFAVAYELEGNLMVPITIHVLGNTAIFALSLVPS